MAKNYSITNGMIAGLAASIISSIYLVGVAALSLVPLNFNIVTIYGNLFGIAANVIAAWVVYYAIGIFAWGIIYALMEPKMQGSVWSKGTLFGLFIFLIVMVVIMPLSGSGIFATKYGFYAILFTLILDLIFGVSLAAIYDKLTRKDSVVVSNA